MISSVNAVQGVVRELLGGSLPVPEGRRQPPLLSGCLPVAGHTVEFVRDTIGLLTRAQRELGEIGAIQVGPKRMVTMFGPQAHEAIFRAPDSVMSPNEAYKITVPVFGKDIVYDATPERMTEQLRMLLPALRDRRMRTYGEIILAEVEQSIADWGDSGVVDIVDYCRVLTNYTSSHCLLGAEFRQGMTDEFARVYTDLERGVTPLAYLNANLPIAAFRKRDKARVRLVAMIEQIIETRRRSGHRGEDFLQTLIDSTYKSGEHLSSHEITGLLLAAMFAGHHTSSVTTAWTLIELLQNPHYKQRVLDQLDAVYANDVAVTYQSLREITATENAVKEALRLHPPLFMLVRVAQQDFEYKGYHIAKGTWVLLSPTVAHRIEEVFAEPHLFDPDRFAPPREEDKRDFAYIAFGGGRHKCLGNAFALLQIKAIIAVLLREYDFTLTGDPVASDFHGLVVGPREPCRLRYRRRARKTISRADIKEALPPPVAAAAAGCPMHLAAQKPVERAPQDVARAVTSLQVIIDRDLCQGHAVCVGEAPEVFATADSDGKVEVLLASPPDELEASVRAAAKYCPNGVITVVDLAASGKVEE